ncbi:hypothetical protein D3C86_940250 [compost metagenome]
MDHVVHAFEAHPDVVVERSVFVFMANEDGTARCIVLFPDQFIERLKQGMDLRVLTVYQDDQQIRQGRRGVCYVQDGRQFDHSAFSSVG